MASSGNIRKCFEAHCDGSTGTCVLTVDGRSYYEEDWVSADVFDGVDLDKYTERGTLGTDGTFVGTVLGAIEDGNQDGVWVRAACALTNGYHAVDDVLEPKYGGRLDISDRIYDDFLECLYTVESYFYGPQ